MRQFNRNIFNSLLIIGLLALVGGGCQQVNDMVNGNATTNTNSAANSNSASNSNTTTNSNASSNTNANSTSTSNSETANSNTAASKPTAIEGDKIEIPSDEKMRAMIKEALLDFNDAVQKGDFTEFRNKVSQPFQKSATVEKFNSAFGQFFTIKTEYQQYTDSLKDMEAELTAGPSLGKQSGYDVLSVSGKYPLSPRNLKFELKYIPEGKEWKIIEIKVDTK